MRTQNGLQGAGASSQVMPFNPAEITMCAPADSKRDTNSCLPRKCCAVDPAYRKEAIFSRISPEGENKDAKPMTYFICLLKPVYYVLKPKKQPILTSISCFKLH